MRHRVCVCVSVCVYKRERESERERVYVSVCQRERGEEKQLIKVVKQAMAMLRSKFGIKNRITHPSEKGISV